VPSSFVAIDFETADQGADSACAVALVRVEHGEIAHKFVRLIRPPRPHFSGFNIRVHGIRWRDVENQPTFGDLWPEVREVLDGVGVLYAHNMPFDRRVLGAVCAVYGIGMPEVEYRCTVSLARAVWGIRPTKLPNVCDYLGIGLRHHDPLSDAEACARIVMRAGDNYPKIST
jgi:DNA polymerase-3 subunit epsilon